MTKDRNREWLERFVLAAREIGEAFEIGAPSGVYTPLMLSPLGGVDLSVSANNLVYTVKSDRLIYLVATGAVKVTVVAIPPPPTDNPPIFKGRFEVKIGYPIVHASS